MRSRSSKRDHGFTQSAARHTARLRPVNISKGSGAAIPLFMQAVNLDPSFALASAHLGRSYGNVGERALAAESIKKAYELRNRASDPEKFFISINYEQDVTGNLEKATQIAESWAQTYPRDVRAHVPVHRPTRHRRGMKHRWKRPRKRSRSIPIPPSATSAKRWTTLFSITRRKPMRRLQRPGPASSSRLSSSVFVTIPRSYRETRQPWSSRPNWPRMAGHKNDWITHAQALVAAYSGRLPQPRKAVKQRRGSLGGRPSGTREQPHLRAQPPSTKAVWETHRKRGREHKPP